MIQTTSLQISTEINQQIDEIQVKGLQELSFSQLNSCIESLKKLEEKASTEFNELESKKIEHKQNNRSFLEKMINIFIHPYLCYVNYTSIKDINNELSEINDSKKSIEQKIKTLRENFEKKESDRLEKISTTIQEYFKDPTIQNLENLIEIYWQEGDEFLLDLIPQDMNNPIQIKAMRDFLARISYSKEKKEYRLFKELTTEAGTRFELEEWRKLSPCTLSTDAFDSLLDDRNNASFMSGLFKRLLETDKPEVKNFFSSEYYPEGDSRLELIRSFPWNELLDEPILIIETQISDKLKEINLVSLPDLQLFENTPLRNKAAVPIHELTIFTLKDLEDYKKSVEPRKTQIKEYFTNVNRTDYSNKQEAVILKAYLNGPNEETLKQLKIVLQKMTDKNEQAALNNILHSLGPFDESQSKLIEELPWKEYFKNTPNFKLYVSGDPKKHFTLLNTSQISTQMQHTYENYELEPSRLDSEGLFLYAQSQFEPSNQFEDWLRIIPIAEFMTDDRLIKYFENNLSQMSVHASDPHNVKKC